jgi:hypothetical protein
MSLSREFYFPVSMHKKSKKPVTIFSQQGDNMVDDKTCRTSLCRNGRCTADMLCIQRDLETQPMEIDLMTLYTPC